MKKLICALLFAICSLAQAADADYYKRTGTKPPVEADGYLGPRLPFSEGGVGFGLQGGVLFKSNGLMLTFTADAIRLDGLEGVATRQVPSYADTFSWPRPQPIVSIPYSTPERTVGVFTVGVSFRIQKP